MSTRTSLWLMSSTCVAALLLAVDSGTAQTTLPNGVTLPPGSVVLNPAAKRHPFIVVPGGRPQAGRMRPNYVMMVPQSGYRGDKPAFIGPGLPLVETPASLACIYAKLLGVTPSNGCNPNTFTTNPSGGSHAIAVVDAYDYANAAHDLATFDSQLGIAAATFTKIYGTGSPSNGCANGPQPPSDYSTSWAVEAALDIEYEHAMAPGAHIYLVEANSDSDADLFNAVQVATKCVSAAGGGQVSMSWGALEFSSETGYDADLSGSNSVTYIAASGDYGYYGPDYPCASPYVVCVGGTTISRSATGNFLSEATWDADYAGLTTNGGPSVYEARPSYQSSISSIVGSQRGVPDFAADGDPSSGVWVYSSTYGPDWYIIGGTSLGAPVIAAFLNRLTPFVSSTAALSYLYGLGSNSTYITHINSGACGSAYQGGIYDSYNPQYDPANTLSTTGIPWSYCDGWGTPKDSGNPN